MRNDIGLIFDLDGTLLDTLADLTDAVNFALRQFGCPQRSMEEVRRAIGNGAKRLIALSLPGKTDDPDVEEVLRVYQAYYKDHCQIKTGPFAGIPEALEKLKKKYPVAVVSNKPDAATKILCQEHFPGVCAMGEMEGCPRKPAPDMVWRAMEAIGVKKAVYIGDSEVDVITAGNAGIPCVSVTWGFRDREEIAEKGGTCFCDVTDELPEVIEDLIRRTLE